jgi:phosphinothricin acetyltransferase
MLEIRPLLEEDWPAVVAIYAEGIATGTATFETATPSFEQFDTGHLSAHRFVGVEGGRVVGWSALAPSSPRACYAGVVESSVYVAGSARGRGVGRTLVQALIASARTSGIWTIHAAMFPENTASVALHRSLGFRVVGRLERIAQLGGVWRDTVLLELRL